MINTDWELCDPGKDGKCLSIARTGRGDGIIYFRNEIAQELEISEYPYCYIHTNGSKMMIAFTQNPPHPGYRKVHHDKVPCVYIAGNDILGRWIKKGEKRVVRPKIDNGNVIINMEELW